MTIVATSGAGPRLFQIQKAQGSNLCIGLDPHIDPRNGLGVDFYSSYAMNHMTNKFQTLAQLMSEYGFGRFPDAKNLGRFLAGVTEYFLTVVEVSWNSGVQLYKPQASFYEQFGQFAGIMLYIINKRIRDLAIDDSKQGFTIFDGKRGDIDTTQKSYFAAYLTSSDDDVVDFLPGQFGFDVMTITTWMGQDVILPGLDWFQKGQGAVIVTRSSNPSGTTLQDAYISGNPKIVLSDKQKSFQLTDDNLADVINCVGRPVTNADVMFYITEQISLENGLSQGGISSLFSVIGSTVIEDGSFRRLRPTGVALVPGFGAQGGSFEKAMPMLINDGGAFQGQGAIFSSSRGHNYSWMKQYGGSGNPDTLVQDLSRAIEAFRKSERQAYQDAEIHYPYAT